MRLTVYTAFDPRSGLPLICGLHDGRSGTFELHDLYIPGSGRDICDIEQSQQYIKRLFLAAQERGDQIITSDFKAHLTAFDLPLCKSRYGVFDLQLGQPDTSNPERARQTMTTITQRLAECPVHTWQQLIGDAAVVYEDWQRRGVLYGGLPRYPKWSQDGAAGRSICSGFNIQGLHKNRPELIENPCGTGNDALLIFDWMSADVRFAALFSGDRVLEQSFQESDPYSLLTERLGLGSDSYDLCKITLLKGINSMDMDSPVFTVYQQLGDWIKRCRHILARQDGYLDTILGRRFWMHQKESQLQVLNGCMQGSVAHAIQLAIRRVWERLGGQVMAEIHDSLVVSCPFDPDAVQETIDTIAPIMLYPFEELYSAGLIGINPNFPFRVSLGRLWHGWQRYRLYRSLVPAGSYNGQPQAAVQQETQAAAQEADAQPPEAGTRAWVNGLFSPSGVRSNGVPEAGRNIAPGCDSI